MNKMKYMKNKLNLMITFACFAAFIMTLLSFFITEEKIKNTPQPDNNIEIVKAEENKPIAPIPKSLSTKKTLQKELPTDIPLDDDFKGIARLSEKSKGMLEAAGVLPADVEGKEVVYLEFDLDSLRKLEVGDTFDLEIPQTQEIFTAEITQVDHFDNGDRSLISNVIGQGGDFHTSIITVGKDAMYGQFTTISGNWVFESKNEYGWIAAKRDLYKNHVEFEPSKTRSEETGEDYTISPNNH